MSAYDLTVSIHAPRAGCDRLIAILVTEEIPFQFTHPVRGATKRSSWMFRNTVVSDVYKRQVVACVIMPNWYFIGIQRTRIYLYIQIATKVLLALSLIHI